MKKKLFICMTAVLVVFLCAPLFAEDRIVDMAGLLSDAEKAELTKLADTIAATYKFDLVIVTEKNIGSMKPMAYADDFFDYNGYGQGNDRDGCLFLQVTGSRDYWFSTSGRGIGILNETAFDRLKDDVVDCLKENNPAGAYRAFFKAWEEFLALDAKGRSYNIFHQYHTIFLVVAWIIAFLIGTVIVAGWKGSMNTALPKTQAAGYIIPGSLAFAQQHDTFLYSTTTQTKRQKSSSSSGGGSHTSSSGRSHGGGGGKY